MSKNLSEAARRMQQITLYFIISLRTQGGTPAMLKLRLKELIGQKKKNLTPFEPWSPYQEGDETHAQQTQPLPVRGMSSPLQETSEQRYCRLKALSDATGVRLLFVYLRDQGRGTIEDRHMRKGYVRW